MSVLFRRIRLSLVIRVIESGRRPLPKSITILSPLQEFDLELSQ